MTSKPNGLRPKCSEVECDKISTNYIWIHGQSVVQNKKYKMLISVCDEHYELEKNTGKSIIEEISFTKWRSLAQ